MEGKSSESDTRNRFSYNHCGENTDTAKGVAAEMTITCEEQKPYFLLRGRPRGNCKKPAIALKTDEIYPWSWESLKALIEGGR